MASPNIWRPNNHTRLISRNLAGFTMIEILIVIGIMATLFSLGLFVAFDFYKNYSFNSERDILVSVLQKARDQSLSNINQTRHGVHIEASPSIRYIIFECPTNNPQCNQYVAGPEDIIITPSYGLSLTSSAPPPFDLIFDQLSGYCVSTICATNPATITVNSKENSYNISINSQGSIDW